MRKQFDWVDPASPKKKKYKDICTTPQIMRLLTDVIQTTDQAEDFFKAYAEVCVDAEHNIGYFARLIHDKDLREDVLDLFMVEEQFQPRQILNREYRLSYALRRDK